MRSSRNDVAMDTPRGSERVDITRGVGGACRLAGKGPRGQRGRVRRVELRRVDLVVDDVNTDVEVLGDVPLRTRADVPLAAIEIAARSPGQPPPSSRCALKVSNLEVFAGNMSVVPMPTALS
jgi:hypothetical protein